MANLRGPRRSQIDFRPFNRDTYYMHMSCRAEPLNNGHIEKVMPLYRLVHQKESFIQEVSESVVHGLWECSTYSTCRDNF